MADGPVCGAGLLRLSLRGAIARGFIYVQGLFVTYEYHSPFFFCRKPARLLVSVGGKVHIAPCILSAYRPGAMRIF